MENDRSKLVLYTSRFCLHSLSVERLLRKHNIDVDIISIDGNAEARQQLITLNDGFASVPTLLFADGTKLTEPSLALLRERLGIEEESLSAKVRGIFSRSDD
jgi:mycoredoxin